MTFIYYSSYFTDLGIKHTKNRLFRPARGAYGTPLDPLAGLRGRGGNRVRGWKGRRR